MSFTFYLMDEARDYMVVKTLGFHSREDWGSAFAKAKKVFARLAKKGIKHVSWSEDDADADCHVLGIFYGGEYHHNLHCDRTCILEALDHIGDISWVEELRLQACRRLWLEYGSCIPFEIFERTIARNVWSYAVLVQTRVAWRRDNDIQNHDCRTYRTQTARNMICTLAA